MMAMPNESTRSRLGRSVVSCLLAVAISTAGAGCTSGSSRPAGARDGGTHWAFSVVQEPWRLPVPVSRLTAIADGNGALLAGGLTAGDASSNGVLRLDVGTGRLQPAGRLAQPVHDASGALSGRVALIFGGGAATTTAAVQSTAGVVVGQLPQPRSDLSAVAISGQVLLIGGYDGHHELAGVLSTTDGRTFRKVATLPTTVRYAAVLAAHGEIWVLGGSHQGRPIATVQRIDPSTGRVTVVGRLPTALSDAAAIDLDGQILLVGGRTTTGVSGGVYDFDPVTNSTRLVTHLAVPVADAAAIVSNGRGYIIGGENAAPVAAVQVVTATRLPNTQRSKISTTAKSIGQSQSLSDTHPFNGRLLIADRGNNRLLLVDAAHHVLWTFPNASAPAPPSGFYFPDDAFFIDHGTAILSNQEGNDTLVELGFPSGRSLWAYGHPRVARSGPGFLHEPDDAYRLRNGNVVVADANNCRIVIINSQGQQIGQIGRPGSCVHSPPTSLGYPNGDTPLSNGNLLISEVHGSWISEYTLTGKLVWTVQLPISYPSDPQQIGPDRYLVADYANPGGLYEFDRAGHILWSYRPASGPGRLDHPSLAEVLPGGYIATNDDYRDRVVIIDPNTQQIIWQYGHTDHRGARPGYLYIPDGFDLLEPDGSTPTHPSTG